MSEIRSMIKDRDYLAMVFLTVAAIMMGMVFYNICSYIVSEPEVSVESQEEIRAEFDELNNTLDRAIAEIEMGM